MNHAGKLIVETVVKRFVRFVSRHMEANKIWAKQLIEKLSKDLFINKQTVSAMQSMWSFHKTE